jgi:hypothetical protein
LKSNRIDHPASAKGAQEFGARAFRFSACLATNFRLAGCIAGAPSTILQRRRLRAAHPDITILERRSIDNAA